MAGKRIYVTIPKRDWALLGRMGIDTQECGGQVARRLLLTGLYAELRVNTDLQEYDAELAYQERMAVIHGR